MCLAEDALEELQAELIAKKSSVCLLKTALYHTESKVMVPYTYLLGSPLL